MDLDERIEKKRIEALASKTLDVNWYDDTVSIKKIYADIAVESQKLRVTGRISAKYYGNQKADAGQNITKVSEYRQKLKSLDNRLRKYDWYDLRIRKILKKFYKGKLLIPTVNVRRLLKQNDSDFIIACYRSILLRAPDEEGLREGIYALRMQNVTKREFIFNLANSDEGRTKNAKLEGGRIGYLFDKALRMMFKIPIIGSFIQNVYDKARIKNALYQMMLRNITIDYDVKKIKDVLEKLEIDIKK